MSENAPISAKVALVSLTKFSNFFELSDNLNEKVYKGFSTEEAELVESLMDRIRKNLE